MEENNKYSETKQSTFEVVPTHVHQIIFHYLNIQSIFSFTFTNKYNYQQMTKIFHIINQEFLANVSNVLNVDNSYIQEIDGPHHFYQNLATFFGSSDLWLPPMLVIDEYFIKIPRYTQILDICKTWLENRLVIRRNKNKLMQLLKFEPLHLSIFFSSNSLTESDENVLTHCFCRNNIILHNTYDCLRGQLSLPQKEYVFIDLPLYFVIKFRDEERDITHNWLLAPIASRIIATDEQFVKFFFNNIHMALNLYGKDFVARNVDNKQFRYTGVEFGINFNKESQKYSGSITYLDHLTNTYYFSENIDIQPLFYLHSLYNQK